MRAHLFVDGRGAVPALVGTAARPAATSGFSLGTLNGRRRKRGAWNDLGVREDEAWVHSGDKTGDALRAHHSGPLAAQFRA